MIAAHALAGSAVWLAALPPALAGLLLGALAASAYRLWRRQPVLYGELLLGADGLIERRRAAHEESEKLQVLPGGVVLAGLIAVRLRAVADATPGARPATQRLLVLADSLHAADFLRLRLWLRWRARVGEDASGASGQLPAAPGLPLADQASSGSTCQLPPISPSIGRKRDL